MTQHLLAFILMVVSLILMILTAFKVTEAQIISWCFAIGAGVVLLWP